MRIMTVAVLLLCLSPLVAAAADKDRTVAMIEAVRLNIGTFKAKAGDSKAASAELGMANSYLGRAEYALEKGKNFLGMVSDEAKQDVRHQTAMAEISLAIGSSRLERSRIEGEAALLAARLEKVKARVKVFDDYRTEIARLKGELAKSSATSKELETLKAEKASLQKQVDKLTAEKELISRQLEQARTVAPKDTQPAKPPQPAESEPMKPEVIMEIAPPADKQ